MTSRAFVVWVSFGVPVELPCSCEVDVKHCVKNGFILQTVHFLNIGGSRRILN